MRMKKRGTNYVLAGCLGLLLWPGLLQAQTREAEQVHSFTVGAAAIDPVTLHDAGGGNIAAGGIAYSFQSGTDTRQKRVGLSWQYGKNSGRSVNGFDLRYNDAFLLSGKDDGRAGWLAGYSLQASPWYYHAANGSPAGYSWVNTNTAAIYTTGFVKLKQQRFTVDIYVPVAGFASVTPAGKQYEHDLNGLLYDSYGGLFFTSWHNLKMAELSFRYEHRLDARLSVIAGVHGRYRKLTTPYTAGEKSYGLSAGLSYRAW